MRNYMELNRDWYFTKENTVIPSTLPVNWEKVHLPHTWNGQDGQDGKGDYHRGACWYAREFSTPASSGSLRTYLEVLACSLTGKVYVNGKEAGYHEGGYSSFTLDITDLLNPSGSNLLVICADNSDQSHIYPRMADFTFYGGLYRGVNLITVPQTHFDLEYLGAPGLTITTKVQPEDNSALIHLNSFVVNSGDDYTVRYLITDHLDNPVAEVWRPAMEPQTDVLLPHPHLWQGVEDPYLYHCTASLVYRNETVDEVSSAFGIRSFHVDPEKGFFLNGKPMMLRGVSRHQDRLHKGYALTRAEHYEDAALIAELGANTVRLAHYQHSRDFYDACDEYGFIVWAEIPYISSQNDDPAAHENCRSQMKELICQNFNHPSICFWGISNEITIAGEKPGMVENHTDLHKLAKSLDPSRLTTIAHVSMLPVDSALHGITDVESYNHYFGWYGGTYDNNEKWLDNFHEAHPQICLGLSEYGAEGIITYQPDEPKCRDYSESYQALYHEHMAKILMERPYLWSTHVWNMFDFGCDARDEGGTAGRNNKGLVTIDRKIKKEAFYVYKAYWSREPFVYLCGRRYARRVGDTTSVKVYSNLPYVTLSVNGQVFATQYGDKIFQFDNVPLGDGFTFLTASADAAVSPCAAASASPVFSGSSTVTDSLTLEKVSEKPEIYTLPEEPDDFEGVANWFNQAEAVAANAPMQYPENAFSVRDTIADVLANEEAYAVFANAMYAITGMKLKKSMLGMMKEKTIESMSSMMSGMGGGENVPHNALQILNNELNKIAK